VIHPDFFGSRKKMSITLFSLVAAGGAAALTPADFEITSLPGLQTPPNFKHYSGYVKFVES
jgi:hypothetical protein